MGLGCRVEGLGSRVCGLGLRVKVAICLLQGENFDRPFRNPYESLVENL